MIALIAALGAFVAVNALFGAIHGFACGSSQFMNMLLRFSILAMPIRAACWFAAVWAGWSVFRSLGAI